MAHDQDTTPEEFESYAFNRKKVIAPGSKTDIFSGHLVPGHYPFFGEFHEKTARGAVIAE